MNKEEIVKMDATVKRLLVKVMTSIDERNSTTGF
jgi:hypothetical protein